MKPTILVDMDGTIVDFAPEVARRLKDQFGVEVDIDKFEQFHFINNVDLHQDKVDQIYREGHDLFFSMLPIDGALEAVNFLRQHYQVRICSSPIDVTPDCIGQKRAWLAKYIDQQIADEAFIGGGKENCPGQLLIDDKPYADRAVVAPWTQIVFTQPWNKHTDQPRISSWDDLGEVKRLIDSLL